MEKVIKVVKTLDNLDDFLKKHDGSIFLYSSYLKVLELNNWEFSYLVMYEEDVLVSVTVLQYKKIIKYLPLYVYQLSYGPVGKVDDELMSYLVNYLKKQAIYSNVWLLNNNMINNEYFKLIDHNYTYIIDLKNSNEEIFNNFSKTYRNIIRRSIKEGVKVEISEDLSLVDEFINNYLKMTTRKSLKEINPEIMKKIIVNLINDKKGFISRTVYENKGYHYAFIGLSNKTARYIYGASLSSDKTFVVGQHLHYEIILYLKERGYEHYDLGGVKGFSLTSDDDSYGVYKFKRNFGGNEVTLTNNYKYYKNSFYKLLFKKR